MHATIMYILSYRNQAYNIIQSDWLAHNDRILVTTRQHLNTTKHRERPKTARATELSQPWRQQYQHSPLSSEPHTERSLKNCIGIGSDTRKVGKKTWKDSPAQCSETKQTNHKSLKSSPKKRTTKTWITYTGRKEFGRSEKNNTPKKLRER